jgi:hypothetical protein
VEDTRRVTNAGLQETFEVDSGPAPLIVSEPSGAMQPAPTSTEEFLQVVT